MIDVRLKTIGGPEIGAKLAQADSGIRDALRDELAQIGTEIVDRARSAAPKRTGEMASRITWYFGERKRVRVGERTSAKGRLSGIYKTRAVEAIEPSGRITFTARPTGRVAHLMERGVNGTVEAHFRNVTRKNVTIWTRKGQRTLKTLKGKAYIPAHPLHIAPRPFFGPAVDSVGGASGVNERLQRRLDWLAGNLSGAR